MNQAKLVLTSYIRLSGINRDVSSLNYLDAYDNQYCCIYIDYDNQSKATSLREHALASKD